MTTTDKARLERVAEAIRDLNVIADAYCYEIAQAAIAAYEADPPADAKPRRDET